MTDSFTRYKQEVFAQYEKVKQENYARFLINPTRAGLRDLCIILLQDEEKATKVDRKIFADFIGFEYGAGIQRLKKETDKFRPLATFLRGETALSDIAAADMVALLVDYEARPYSKYLREVFPIEEISNAENIELQQPGAEIFTPKTGGPMVGLSSLPEEKKEKKKFWKRKEVIIIIFSVAILAVYPIKKEIFPAKECMQWNTDHYEEVVCEGKEIGFAKINPIFDKNEDLLDFKKIAVSRKTVFFKDNQPLVWYVKQGGVCEYFNGPGLHPVSGKPLLPITKYMIEKHVLNVE
ncbi:MAG TPA: hypothetical protein VK476_07420 [Flavobacterium sp.]|nr:hypothetical protein [Flavobacterium sp.]